jgi:hypothetical protein
MSALNNKRPSSDEVLLFIDFSYFEAPLGFKFYYFLENSKEGTSHFPFNGTLQLVTQQWGLPFVEGIPEGHKTLCSVKVDAKSLELLSSTIPIADSWEYQEKIFLLSNVYNDSWKTFYAPLNT